MPRRLPSLAKALRFVDENGTVLESAHGPVPTFVDFVVGEKVTHWWSHPQAGKIFALTRAIRDSPDVLICRLVHGKISYVHRRLWPALARLSHELDKRNLAAIREEHLPNGKHRVTEKAFPGWVPAHVLRQSKKLTEEQARLLLGNALD